jgi:hypothetical protein
MADELMQAFLDVERAMQHYNRVLEAQVTALRTSEAANATKIERMTQGAKAMRDSSSIYLSYAKFVAYGMPDSEELVEDDLQT